MFYLFVMRQINLISFCPSQTVILRHTTPTPTLPLQHVHFSQLNLFHVLHWFLYHVLPIQSHTISIGYTKSHSERDRSNILSFFIQI